MSNKSFIEDMLTLGGGMLNNLVEARHEVKAQVKNRAGSLARDLDLVPREEFDAAFAMLAKARTMQEELSDRVSRIENHLNLSRKKTSPKKQVKTANTNLPFVKTKKKTRSRK
jgi:BMFP domain-containing protein YqiC